MEKRIKLFNRAVQSLLGGALLFGLLFIVSCDNGDDPEPEPYQLPGIYTFNKATLQTELTMPFEILGNPVVLDKGTDITSQMEDGLLAEAPCDNPENGAVELKENKQLFFVCIGEDNEDQTGTWDINSDTTELTMVLSVAVGTLNLKIESLEIDETTDIISGSIANFPITKALLAGFMSGYGLTQEQINDILADVDDTWVATVDVDIEFQKEE
jgi:hypothetical protein